VIFERAGLLFAVDLDFLVRASFLVVSETRPVFLVCVGISEFPPQALVNLWREDSLAIHGESYNLSFQMHTRVPPADGRGEDTRRLVRY
jgi:hypothetical protein